MLRHSLGCDESAPVGGNGFPVENVWRATEGLDPADGKFVSCVHDGGQCRTKRVITVDVFDTLILRRPRSRKRRDHDAATRFDAHNRLDAHNRFNASISRALSLGRQRATHALWRAARFAGAGDIRLEEAARLTLETTGYPAIESMIDRFRETEIAAEASALYPNRSMLEMLADAGREGARVIAISDTPLRAEDLWRLLRAVIGGAPPLDALHTSADHDATKRDGSLFHLVAGHEGFSLDHAEHFGDDTIADGVQAERAGLRAHVVPRARTHHVRRRADAARFHLAAMLRPAYRHPRAKEEPVGPVVADAMHRLWMRLRAIDLLTLREREADGSPTVTRSEHDRPTVLFCARGGLVIEALLERFIERTELPLALPRRELMVSRIVACRAALLVGSSAAYEECAREFRGETMATALRALSGEDGLCPPGQGDAPFDPHVLQHILASPEGVAVKRAMRVQSERFEAHLRAQLGGSRRAILVDTGLYGSTLRLLADAFPDIAWHAVLLARSNYKGLNADHFADMQGVWCERDTYSPLDIRSIVLRYWQWVEDLFEPDLPSVREFDARGRGTLERAVPDWRGRVLSDPEPALAEAIAFIDRFAPDDLIGLDRRAGRAWRTLYWRLAFPSVATAARYAVSERSRDFGLDGSVSALTPDRTLSSLRKTRWKEGALAAHFPRMRWVPQALLELAYGVRWLRSRARS